MSWVIQVSGTPWPKGSLTAIMRGKRPVLVEQSAMNNPGHKAWRAAVTDAGKLLAARLDGPLDCPVIVQATITVPLPPGRASDPWPHMRPSRTTPGGGDIDKMGRLLLDALTDADVWRDDSRVVGLYLFKTYPGRPIDDALDEPGAVIRIWRAVKLGEIYVRHQTPSEVIS